MTRATRSRLLYAALGALYLLHNDLWLWHDARLVFGLPAGLAYHIAFAAATSIVLTLLVLYAWPEHLDREVADRVVATADPETRRDDGR